MVVQEGTAEQPNIVGRWSEALKALHGRLAPLRSARRLGSGSGATCWGQLGWSSARTAGSLQRRSERRIQQASTGCLTLRSETRPWCAMICAST